MLVDHLEGGAGAGFAAQAINLGGDRIEDGLGPFHRGLSAGGQQGQRAVGGPSRAPAGRRIDKGAAFRLNSRAQASRLGWIHRHAGDDQRVGGGRCQRACLAEQNRLALRGVDHNQDDDVGARGRLARRSGRGAERVGEASRG